MEYTIQWKSPIGTLTIASDGNAITGLWMEGQAHFCAGFAGDCLDGSHLPVIRETISILETYFQGKIVDPSVIPLCPKGTAFQKSVWVQLQNIPYGETKTYGQIAAALEASTGRRASPRAVGAAIGRNPISILIPCHRIVGAGGSLTGYAGGIRRKEFLLQLENGTA